MAVYNDYYSQRYRSHKISLILNHKAIQTTSQTKDSAQRSKRTKKILFTMNPSIIQTFNTLLTKVVAKSNSVRQVAARGVVGAKLSSHTSRTPPAVPVDAWVDAYPSAPITARTKMTKSTTDSLSSPSIQIGFQNQPMRFITTMSMVSPSSSSVAAAPVVVEAVQAFQETTTTTTTRSINSSNTSDNSVPPEAWEDAYPSC